MNVLDGKRVLVVEDEPLVAMLVEDMLGDLGAVCVGVAASVAEAFVLLRDQPIDAAVLDLNLRGERSIAVADWLRSRSIPFAFATGYGEASAETAGAQILAKPYSQEQLRDVLMRALGLA